MASLVAFASSFDEETVTSVEKEKYFYIKIPSQIWTILVVKEPNVSIEADSDIKEEIEKKLTDDDMIPTLFSYYKLNIKSLTEGNVTEDMSVFDISL